MVLLIESDFFHGVVMGIIFCVTVGYFGNKHFTIADMLDLLFDDRINYNPVRENDHNEVRR